MPNRIQMYSFEVTMSKNTVKSDKEGRQSNSGRITSPTVLEGIKKKG